MPSMPTRSSRSARPPRLPRHDHGDPGRPRQLRWHDRVVDLYPDFQLKDAWVTHEFRAFDLLAQRSGLPLYVNDMLAVLAMTTALIRSLRDVEPVSSFRSTFAYTNITHLLAGRIVANSSGAANWNDVVARSCLHLSAWATPAGRSSDRGRAEPCRRLSAVSRRVETSAVQPALPLQPWRSRRPQFNGRGRCQVGASAARQRHVEGRRLVSDENLAVTRTPKVAINDRNFYALGWLVTQTPNGDVVWHNGGTNSFGAYIGLQLDRGLGVIVLTNQQNVGFPDAVGAWLFDRMLDNPSVDYAADKLKLLRRNSRPTPTPMRSRRARAVSAARRPCRQLRQPEPRQADARDRGRRADPRRGRNRRTVEARAVGRRCLHHPPPAERRFAVEAANLGELQRLRAISDGCRRKLGSLRLSFDGQAYDLRRE